MTTMDTEPVLGATPDAIQQLRRLLEAQHPGESKPLRVYVEAGGCSGLKYGMLFDEHREGDVVFTSEGISVVVDAQSAAYLRGSVLDFSDSLTGGGFKVRNPNARQSCGCGQSFEA